MHMENTHIYLINPSATIKVNDKSIRIKDIEDLIPHTITTYNRACAALLYVRYISEALQTPFKHISIDFKDIYRLIERK